MRRVVSCCLILLMCSVSLSVVTQRSISQGPRTEDLIMKFYADGNLAYNALKTGEIDIFGYCLGPCCMFHYLDAYTDPNIALVRVESDFFYELDINNNWTIATYPGIRSPTSYQSFRQTLAFLVDKNYIVDTLYGGYATRIDQPLGASNHGWWNQSYTGTNYPYEFNPDTAATLLDTANFTQGTTPNPNYDPGLSWSAQYLRTYPSDHNMKPNETLDPLVVYVRTDDPRRRDATRLLCDNLRTIGVPVQQNEGPSSYTYDPVMGRMDYHVYLGGWSGWRFPTPIYFLYHSSFWEPYGSNYVSGMNASNLPNYPELDALLYNVYHADFLDDVVGNCSNALGLFTELCVNIPLLSPMTFWGYNADLLGVVNMDAYSIENRFTFLNAYKVDGSPLRYGTITPPNQLNIQYSSWWYDYQCLNRVYEFGGFDIPPYNFVADQPGFILDWTVDLWMDGNDTKHKVTKVIRTDNFFVNTDGEALENVDADAYLFSNYVLYAIGIDSWHWDTVQDVKLFNKLDEYSVEIYYDARSYWLYTSASPPLIPMSVWLNTSHGLTENLVETFVVDTNLTTPGFLGLGSSQPNGPVWINSIVSDLDGALEEWVDFHWELGDWYMDTPLSSGAVVTVDYYVIDDVSGFTLGDNSWEDVTIGCGMYYGTDFLPGVDGYFTLKKNPYYFRDTPVLGEVDFVWEEGGYYEITIFDVVKAAGAYGSQGIAVPDDNWLSGADVAPPGGSIDIFDIVTIASEYGTTWGHP